MVLVSSMPMVPQAANMPRHGSSQQLFVLMEEQEPQEVSARGGGLSFSRQQSEESFAESEPADGPNAAASPKLLAGVRVPRAMLLLLAAAGSLALVLFAWAAAAGSGAAAPSATKAPTEALRTTQQKDGINIGTAQMPDLPAPPQPHIMHMGHPAYHCTYGVAAKCPASELLFNAEVHEVCTENLMRVGRGLFKHADREIVRDAVSAGFRNISRQLAQRWPEAMHQLEQVTFTEREKNSLVSALRLMSVPSVQRIGFEVALAVRRSLSFEPQIVRQKVQEMLQSNVAELMRLREDLISGRLQELWGDSGLNFALTLQPENVQVMEAFHEGEFFGSMSADFYAQNRSGAPGRLPPEEKSYGAWGGVLEEGRVFLGLVRLAAHASGHGDVDFPAEATSLSSNVDVRDLGSELLSCELHKKDGMNNFMKALFCPLKYGSQGLEALRSLGQMAQPMPIQ